MKKLILQFTISIVTLSAFAQQTEYNWDTITFEKPYKYLTIGTSSQNIWEIGRPDKPFFDSAYAGTKCILTDTINNYPINNYSFFDLKIGSFNFNTYYPYDIYIEIKHKYDTDTLKDGGYITVSYDNGKTWMNIIKDTAYRFGVTPAMEHENLYTEKNSLYNGEYGFSGNSGGWVSTWFSWHAMLVKSAFYMGDTMVIRFNFISDSIQSNKEGWMIDNIRLYSVDLGGGIENLENRGFKIYPNPMNEISTIELNKNYGKTQLELFSMDGQLIKYITYSNKKIINFNRDNLKSGIYLLKISSDSELIGTSKLLIK
jgi:hypothetical protein